MTVEIAVYPPSRTDLLAPPPEFAQLRRETPVTKVPLWDGSSAWLVTSYALAREVFRDHRFSSDARKPGYPSISPAAALVRRSDTSLLRMDDPEHRVLRKMAMPEFLPRRAESYAPIIQTEVDDLLTAMLAKEPPVDFVKEFALALPSIVICRLLGVPYSEHDEFQAQNHIRLAGTYSVEEIQRAEQALLDLIDRVVTSKELEPTDDLISRLIVAGREPDADRTLTHHELVMMGNLMLGAGFDTTANMLGLSVLVLTQHPEQAAELRSDPSLMPAAVEELLRFLSIAQFTPARVATEDVEIGGQLIRAGEGVLLPLSAANWDDSVFPEPERFDIHRKEARNQIGFGFGNHQCIGQTLARVELRIALQAILERVPTLRVVPPVEELKFKHGAAFYGVFGLPVAW